MPPQLLGGFDETIQMMMIIQTKKPAFKKLFMLVKKFQVAPPAARGMSSAESATSSMHLGFSTT